MGQKIPSEVIDDGAMYVSERKVYPREIDGLFQKLRHSAVYLLLGLYYVMPWLQIDGRQAVLFDLPARKFYILWLTFWPQDFFFLALLLIMAALSLFFFTAVAGRLWCGYACPQTVWTEVFMWMERWTEGNRSQRMKLDAAPNSLDKFRRKGSKYVLWILFSLWTGLTFVGFFTPIRELAPALLAGTASGWAVFWLLFYSFATYGNAGILREQVCKYMCPYARFQSAMFDRNTLIISYDARRGEPRGPRKKGTLASVLERARGLIDEQRAQHFVIGHAKENKTDANISTGLVVDNFDDTVLEKITDNEQLGDCIDCTICVQVCPTGIDIRNGLQYECIACGACIDACDEVMDKLGYPKGLVRYTTHNALVGHKVKLLRPRIVIYALLLLALLAGTIIGIANREPLLVDVMRDKQLYRLAPDGSIENTYTLRLINKTGTNYDVDLHVEVGDIDAELIINDLPIHLGAESIMTLPVTVRTPANCVRGMKEIEFKLTDKKSDLKVEEESRFFGPSDSGDGGCDD
jgi:polyferredoxin